MKSNKLLKLALIFTSATLGFNTPSFSETKNNLEKVLLSSIQNQQIEQISSPYQHSNLVEESILESKKEDKYAIIVDKSDYTLQVYKSGELMKTYPIELGFNPDEDKKVEGDGATPEGKFYLTHKNPQSQFYRSLGISYPNIEDAKRGLENDLISQEEHDKIKWAITQKAVPPGKTKLGGEIFIHGKGTGKAGNNGGNNWTWGCVALSNKDIKELYTMLPTKTPITIVK